VTIFKGEVLFLENIHLKVNKLTSGYCFTVEILEIGSKIQRKFVHGKMVV